MEGGKEEVKGGIGKWWKGRKGRFRTREGLERVGGWRERAVQLT